MAELFVPDPEQMRDQMLDDFELAAIDEGVAAPPVQPGSDWYGLATAVANLHSIALQNIRLADADTTPLTATDVKLEDWRESLGVQEIVPTGAIGLVVVETFGSATITAGEQLTANGKRYEVTTTYLSIANNDEIEVQAVDTGDATNLDPGAKLEWVTDPTNVRHVATVSDTQPVQGGTSQETDERKRTRILNDLQTRQAGGNWGQLRQVALDASPAVQNAYIYPALGGPSSVKVVITKRFNTKIGDFSRTPSATLKSIVEQALWANFPDMNALVVNGAADQATSMAMQIEIPDSLLAGGDGTGWLDAAPWPTLESTDNGFTAVSDVIDAKTIVVDADTATAPVAGQTRLAWWSPTDQKFVTRLVISQSGSAGTWTIGLDQPLAADNGTIVAIGDYVCPGAANLASYGLTWRDIMQSVGPAENTTDSNRTPHALRHPSVDSIDSPALNASQTKRLLNAHSEITDISYSYRERTTPTVPASVATAPNVLTIDNLAFYPAD